LPSPDCMKYHPECVENDMDSFSERWARGLLGDEEYEKRMKIKGEKYENVFSVCRKKL